MAQPTPYVPSTDFSADEGNGVSGRSTVRTAALDAELANIQTTVGEICENLGLLQRDDGALLDGIVTVGSLSSEVLDLIASGAFLVRGPWLTTTAYAKGDIVSQGGAAYLCFIAHTSGTFATDLANGDWIAMTVTNTATGTSFSPTTNISATNVQAAITEVDSELRPSVALLNHQLFRGL